MIKKQRPLSSQEIPRLIAYDCALDPPTPALITLGSSSWPMLKSIPIALPTMRITKTLTPAMRKKGELMSFLLTGRPAPLDLLDGAITLPHLRLLASTRVAVASRSLLARSIFQIARPVARATVCCFSNKMSWRRDKQGQGSSEGVGLAQTPEVYLVHPVQMI